MFQPKLTADGSYTFFSHDFNETFHSQSGAKEEAQYKFVEPLQLAEKAQTSSQLKLLDICYGLGYNSAAALNTIWQINPQCHIELIALEFDKAVPHQALSYGLLNDWEENVTKHLTDLANSYYLETELLSAQLLIEDARLSIQKIHQSGFKADAIFLDPFSPPKCPQLWSVEFLTLVAKCLKPQGRLATYSCAASVRSALILAGLHITSSQSVGRLSPGTIASFDQDNLPELSQQEKEYLQTRAAIPYRDPHLIDTQIQIQQRREAEQEISNLQSTSQWKKRWFKA